MESLKLQRKILGSINIGDITDEELSESERKAYVSAVFALYPIVEKDIKKFMHTQLMFQAWNAENWEQVLFSRGSLNGMDLLLQHWKKSYDEHIANSSQTPEFDKHNPMPEL